MITRISKPGAKKRLVRGGLVAAILIACLVPSTAQENLGRGRVTGQVVDNSGNPIEDALIVAQSLQSTAKLEGKSDRKGNFAIAGFGTGMWRFTATKEGYASAFVDQEIRQLRANTPVRIVLEKLTGLAAFQADKAGQELLEKGNALFEEGRYDDAVRIFEEFSQRYPEVYQARINIASSHFRKGDLESAETEYTQILETIRKAVGGYSADKATSVRALTGLGEIQLAKQNFEEARDFFSQGLALSPEDEAAAYNVGEIFFSNQQIDEAIKYFEMAIRIKPSWSKAYHKLGLVYLNKGDFEKSLEYLRKFIEIDPENPEVPTVRNIIDTISKMKK
ncbi:MAG: tetratricopeptide repeat protein [Acidobacteriota bacterium]|nr:tetratricopeptide repeat protein [Acidobacteriota bacterium]